MRGPLKIGVVMLVKNDGHAFFFGPMNLDPQAAGDYLPDSSVRLAFHTDLVPWSNYDDVRVSAVYGLDPEDHGNAVADCFRHRNEIRRCTSLSELLEHCDAVMLINGGGDGSENPPIVEAIIDAGKPLNVDKYLAADLGEAIRLARRAREAGVWLTSASLLQYVVATRQFLNGLNGAPVERVTGFAGPKMSLLGGIHPLSHFLMAAGFPTLRHLHVEDDQVSVQFDNGPEAWLRPDKANDFMVRIEYEDGTEEIGCPLDDYRPATDAMLREFIGGAIAGRREPAPESRLLEPQILCAGLNMARSTPGPVTRDDIVSAATAR